MPASFTSEPGDMNRCDLARSPTETAVPSEATADPAPMSIDLVPATPMMLDRYTAADKYAPQADYFIPPVMFCNPISPYISYEDRATPRGWEKHIHPEGGVYYWNSEHQVITHSDIFEASIAAIVDRALEVIRGRMTAVLPKEDIKLHLDERSDAVPSMDSWHWGLPEWEVTLEVIPGDGKCEDKCKYYIADWQRCCVFWLEEDYWKDENTPNPLKTSMLGIDVQASYDQLHLSLQAEFWRHVEYFSGHRKHPPNSLRELKLILQHAALDRMTSFDSTVSRQLKDLETSLQLFPEETDDPLHRRYINTYIGRHLSQIYEERSMNLYGTPFARMDRTQSRYHEPLPETPKSLLGRALKIFSFAFIFDEPQSFYRRLCETWVDRTVYIDQWRSLLRDVQKEWKSTGFMATVILAVNTGFLAINQLGGGGGQEEHDLPLLAQVLSVTSTLFSLGSIVSGMILRHQHRALDTEFCTAEHANKYMHAYAQRGSGLYTAAVLFSLPFGMLLWSLILFIAGILSFSFMSFSHIASPFVAATTGIAILLVVTQIWYFRKLEPARKGSTWVLPPHWQEPDSEAAADTDAVEGVQADNTVCAGGSLAEDSAPTVPPRLSRMHTFAKTVRRMSTGIWSTTTAVESPADVEPASPDEGWFPSLKNLKRGSTRRSASFSFTGRSSTSTHESAGTGSHRTTSQTPGPLLPTSQRPPGLARPVFPLRTRWLSRSRLDGKTPQQVGEDPMAMVESPISMVQDSGSPWAYPSVIRPALHPLRVGMAGAA